jgi:hypothetical protein
MAKALRLYNIQGEPKTDWQNCEPYGSTAIGQIDDPEAAKADKVITSVPTPFARIDLVKTAFKEVVKIGNLDGKTIFHKMVSEAFDVAEIFFNSAKLKDKIEILIWDRKDLDTGNVFGKTLEKYLIADAQPDIDGKEPYNFSRLERFYLLNYTGKDKPASLNIIGATSPATMFFSVANKKLSDGTNELKYVSDNISFGADKPFDNNFRALYQRSDFEFVKYFFIFRKAYLDFRGDFSGDFPEVDEYLDATYNKLSGDKKSEIDSATETGDINNYEPITIYERGTDNRLDILGRPFHKKLNTINWKSDFEIKSGLYKGRKPLALPVEKGNTYGNLIFTTDVWGKENKAPYYNGTPLPKRCLPFVGDEYPYLTVSDFLTDTIVRMPYELNGGSFYNGGYKSEKDSYLLPLKDTFFRFFTAKQLQETVDNNKKMFELQDNAAGVKAILRIPIQKGYVEYTRLYLEGNIDVNEIYSNKANDGAILDKKIGLGIMPLIKFPDEVDKYYHIALFEKEQKDVSLKCYKDNDENGIKEEEHIYREYKSIEYNECSKEAYVITDNFTRIKVTVGDKEGVIIPIFKEIGGNKIYTFAIDFGTTNSHIEYGFVTGKGQVPSDPIAFDIPFAERQMHRLHTLYSDLDINGAFLHNFVPDTIGNKTKVSTNETKTKEEYDFSFPMRTVFAEWNKNNRNDKMYALANGNIPFLYEKEFFPDSYNTARTELKWRDEEEDCLVKLYLENIFILLRNKVALNGGDLHETKIIWFYPASMDTGKFDNFNGYWKEFYKKYFGGNANQNLITISESAAPFRYYKRKKGASNVVTIDVGGGTTDVYIVENNQPQMLLSFLFASNAIFGDGGIGGETRWDSDSNGFIQRYYKDFLDILNTVDDGKLQDLADTLSQIERRHNSPDIIAFLFSLLGNKKVKGNDSLDFLKKLSNNKKFKYVFIMFYGSILYFIAKSMKAKGLNQPITLAFSGNGAKTLRILSSNNNTIGTFAKLIFKGVFGQEPSRLDIIFEDEPKKATSKGGIIDPTPQTPADIKKIKFTLTGNDLNNVPTEDVKFEQITADVQAQIVDSALEFVDFLFELHEKNDEFLTTVLGADDNIVEEVKEICKDRVELEQSLKHALSHRKPTKKVEETLFFYPFIGLLHELAQKVNKM